MSIIGKAIISCAAAAGALSLVATYQTASHVTDAYYSTACSKDGQEVSTVLALTGTVKNEQALPGALDEYWHQSAARTNAEDLIAGYTAAPRDNLGKLYNETGHRIYPPLKQIAEYTSGEGAYLRVGQVIAGGPCAP